MGDRTAQWKTDTQFDFGSPVKTNVETSGEGVSAKVQLKKQIPTDNNVTFTTAANYTADANSFVNEETERGELLSPGSNDFDLNVEGENTQTPVLSMDFIAGTVRIKDDRPSNALCAAGYGTDEDLDWGNGADSDLIGALTLATIVDGKLDCANNYTDHRYVDYDADKHADMLQKGCIDIKWVPAYTGGPSGNTQSIWDIFETGTNNNRLSLQHLKTEKDLRLSIWEDDGTNHTLDFGVYEAVNGTEVLLSINFDLDTGAIRLFVDGVQLGATFTDTGTRTGTIDTLRIGANRPLVNAEGHHKFTYFIIFDAVQHTSNYTPGGAPPTTIFATNDPSVRPNAGFAFGSPLDEFTVTATDYTNTSNSHVVSSDNGVTPKYWNGSAWVPSDKSPAQRNDEATIHTNIASLAASGTFLPESFLESDGKRTSRLDNIKVSTTGNPLTGIIEMNFDLQPSIAISWLTIIENVNKPAGTDVKYQYSTDSGSVYNGSFISASALQTAVIALILAKDGTDTLRYKFQLIPNGASAPTIGNLNTTSDSYELTGSYESTVFNINEDWVATWKEINQTITTPAGTTLDVQTRYVDPSGDGALNPGSVYTTRADGAVHDKESKYMQWKADFTSDGSDTSTIDIVEIVYEFFLDLKKDNVYGFLATSNLNGELVIFQSIDTTQVIVRYVNESLTPGRVYTWFELVAKIKKLNTESESEDPGSSEWHDMDDPTMDRNVVEFGM